MTTSVITARPGTPFNELVDLMLRHGVSALPVVDEHQRVVGIVSEADIVSKEAYGGRRRRLLDVLVDITSGGSSRWALKGRGAVAKELMTAGPRTVSPDAELPAVARLMVDLHYKRFPVVEDGVLVGIVSRRDVLRLLEAA